MDAFGLVWGVAAAQGGVFTMAEALALGLARHQVENLCHGGLVRRLARATFLVEPSADERGARIRAAVSSFGRRAVAVLDTAAEIHGVAGLRTTDEVHVCVPGDAPRKQRANDPDVVVHQLVLRPGDITRSDGVAVTTPVRTVADVILRAHRFEGVCVLDSALSQKLMTADECATLPALLYGRRGAVHARSYLAEADGRARSPLETRVRLRCVDGGVAPDEVGYTVRDEYGGILAEADLAWLRARVIAEADGAGPHRSPEALFEDRRRQNRLADAGWLVLRFTWADTLRDYIPYVVRSAIANRLRPVRL